MKQAIALLLLAITLCSFGQDTIRIGEMLVIQSIPKVKANRQDTVFLTVEKKHLKSSDEYALAPKESDWKLVTPKSTRLTGVERDSVMYRFQKAEQAEWVDVSPNVFTHEINVAKHSLATQPLTYDQVKYLTDLPYLK